MRPSILMERILKVLWNVPRPTDQIVDIFDKKYGYQPQTIKNTISILFKYGYLNRRKKSRYYVYIASERGRKLLLDGQEIVPEVVGSSSKDDGQMMLRVFTR